VTERVSLNHSGARFAFRGPALDALAAKLRSARSPLFALICGRDRRGDAARLLAALRARGVVVQKNDAALALPDVHDEVLVAFCSGDPSAVALLLPAVQSARMAARRLPASGPVARLGAAAPAGGWPAYSGGVRVAAGDINSDWKMALVAPRWTGARAAGGEHEIEYDIFVAK
jgi:hypothetical protein